MYLLFFFLIPKLIFSLELNLVCTNNNALANEVDVKDIFVLLNTDNKRVDLGGLSFEAENILVTNSNISWFSKNCNFEKNCHEPNEYRWYQREVATGHIGWMH